MIRQEIINAGTEAVSDLIVNLTEEQTVELNSFSINMLHKVDMLMDKVKELTCELSKREEHIEVTENLVHELKTDLLSFRIKSLLDEYNISEEEFKYIYGVYP